jgi:Polyprenyl synthetase
VFGEGVALLAGDGLLTEALHLMSGPDVTRRVPTELSHAVGVAGLVGGQALDREAENDTDVDLAVVEWIHVRKTGALILASIRAGARCPGGSPLTLAGSPVTVNVWAWLSGSQTIFWTRWGKRRPARGRSRFAMSVKGDLSVGHWHTAGQRDPKRVTSSQSR